MRCKGSRAKSIQRRSQRLWQRYSGNSGIDVKEALVPTLEELKEDDEEIEELLMIVFLRGGSK